MPRIVDTELFIEKARRIHGLRYNYDEVVYIDDMHQITIKCMLHGVFDMIARYHLKGSGCIACQDLKRRISGMNLFFERSRAIHGNRYDYSKVRFKTMADKVEIICPAHGSFFMSPTNHCYQGSNCPKCSRRRKR